MGQSSQSGATGGSKLPSQQLTHRLPMVTAPDIAGALPVSGEQQLKARQALLNVDVSNPDNIRMAGDIFGSNANKNTNKYTQQGASYRPPSDTSSTADSEQTTVPTPAPAAAPASPPPPSAPAWNPPSDATPTDNYVSVQKNGDAYYYSDDNGSVVNDPYVDPNTGRRYQRIYDNQSG